jgi:uncharacterized membrane protein YfcA/endonuclease/exonuclease/phosphatase family metal-dependent hydrolase
LAISIFSASAGISGLIDLSALLGPDVTFSIAGAVLIGLGVGFLSGLLGVGGGFLLAPMLNGLLGIPLRIAGPSDLCQIQGTSLSGLIRHSKQGNADMQIALLVLGGTFCGTFCGVELMEHLKSLGDLALASGDFPLVEIVLLFLFLGVLGIIGTAVLIESTRSARKADGGAEAQRKGFFSIIRIPPYVTPVGGSPVSVIVVAYSGLLVGLLQALLGIGGGVLLLPILVYFIGVATHAAVGTSLMIVFAASIVGTFMHALKGNISVLLVAALLVGGTFGSQVGARVSSRIAAHKLRKYFSLLVVLAVGIVGFKLGSIYGLFGSGNQLRVVTYNVLADQGQGQLRTPALMKLLAASRAEIIGLQEVTPQFASKLHSQKWFKQYHCTLKTEDSYVPGGLLILSRLPIEKQSYHQLTSAQGRGVLLAGIKLSGRSICIAVVHLESPLARGPQRRKQLQEVFAHLRAAKSDDAILLGDFNFGQGSPEEATIPESFKDLWLATHQRPTSKKTPALVPAGFTWNIEKNPMARTGSFPGEFSRRLDRILLRSDYWHSRSSRIIGDQPINAKNPQLFPSDHFGLRIVLSNRPQSSGGH